MGEEKIVKSQELEIFKRSTLGDVLYTAVRVEPEVVAISYREPGTENFVSLTYLDFGREVKALAMGLLHLGIQKGDKISILAETRYEWPLADFAILTTGGVTVTIYPTLSPSSVEYIINDSDSQMLFVEDQEQLDKVMEVSDKISHLKYIITMEKTDKPWSNIYTVQEIQEMGRNNNYDPIKYDEVQQSIHPDDLCSIVYSSGTTGQPKGVMLSHWNFVSNLFAMREVVQYSSGDDMLVFLPFAHVYMRVVYFAALAGRQTCYFSRPDRLAEDLPVVRPAVMTAVPRLWERVYDRMIQRVESSRITRRLIFYWAARIAREMGQCRSKKIEPPPRLKRKHRLAERIVYKRLRAMAGLDRLKTCVSAGSALPKDLAYFYNGIGFPLLEGYGLTETAAPANINPSHDFRPGSIGPPLPGVEQKIAEDGEILIRGHNVMMGYYKLPEETKESFTEDGWLKTGDIGEFDEEGYLYFKERKKHLLVLSTGKNVAPLPIEDKLKESPWVEEAVVIGDDKKYVSALIQPQFSKLLDFARTNAINFDENLTEYAPDQAGEEVPVKVDPALLAHEKVQEIFRQAVDEANRFFNDFEKVKKFQLLDNAISQERGELTPTLKIKRNIMASNYGELIDTLYE